jgi:hypothetical protein
MASRVSTDRLEQAEAIVKRYIRRNSVAGVCIRMAGFFPSPGAATAALCTAINSQVPMTYQPLARDIIGLYEPGRDDLPQEFNLALFTEIGRELFREHPVGVAASWWPLVGGLAGEALESIISLELTRIVGTMTMVYCENDFDWIGSCAETQRLVRLAHKAGPHRCCRGIAADLLESHAALDGAEPLAG